MKSRLGLGTAQLGQTYGVVGPSRAPSPEVAAAILQRAACHGVRTLDTAPVYGDSERLIGDFTAGVASSPFRVVTKVPRGVPVAGSLQESIGRLRCERLHAVLVHDVSSLLGPEGAAIRRELDAARDMGLVEKLGASVYSGDEIDALLARWAPDVIQLPVSVADQRLLKSGHLDRLAERGVEIHARSVFLQGTLLAEPEKIKPCLTDLLGALRGFRGKLDGLGLTPLEASLGFVAALDAVDVILVGVHTPEQLLEIFAVAETALDAGTLSHLALDDPLLVNPALWPTSSGSAGTAP